MSNFLVGDTIFNIDGVKYECRRIANRPYYISRCGEIISVVKSSPKVMAGNKANGYRGIILTIPTREVLKHHILVMRYFVGVRPPGMVINHKDAVKANNRLENLEYCTAAENRRHAMLNRRYYTGSRCSISKLKEEEVIIIRAAHGVGLSGNQLARAFGVSKKTIFQIIKRRIWKDAERFVSEKTACVKLTGTYEVEE